MKKKELDIIVPICLYPQAVTAESCAKSIIYQHKNYGFKRFASFCPTKGWRSLSYPPREHYIECAQLFAEVKEKLKDYDIECGWFVTLTLKSGPSEEFTKPVKADGTNHKFSSCPLDLKFRKRFSEDIALVCKIAKPAFLFTEDDFSLRSLGECYCKHHLNEFSKRQGRYYSREELLEIFSQKTPESYKFLREWRELAKDSLKWFAEEIRNEVDKESPEIPIGFMQPGGADHDGDVTETVSRALAGKNHIPMTRLCGSFYCGVDVRAIPEKLYHAMYSKQHLGDGFKIYHESDAYPHTKFFTAGQEMKAMMSVAYSYGFDGSLFFLGGLSSCSDEESVYGEMYAGERKRFNEVHRIAKECELKGVEIDYDPFWNTADRKAKNINPLWARSISRFGIPYTSLNSNVTFWDMRQAEHADHDTVMKKLSEGLFLDGDAAKYLCERGYGKYIGVTIGEDVIKDTPLVYDLGSYEVIRGKFATKDNNGEMPCAHSFCPQGTGKWLKMTVTDEKCQVVTEAYTFQNELITPTMTAFENELGGKVVVMSLTLAGNNSQALFNYRRQKLIQELIKWCSDEFVFVEDDPDVFIIANEPKSSGEKQFIGMLTLINLCADTLNKPKLHFPEKWKNAKKIRILNKNGEWEDVKYYMYSNGIEVECDFKYCEPVYILAK